MDIYKQVIPNKVLKFKNSNFKKYTKIYGIFSVGGGQNPAKSVFPSFRGVKRCAKSNGGCQSDGGRPPDISGTRLGFGASPASKSPCPGSVL
jgi:hypothetical protein